MPVSKPYIPHPPLPQRRSTDEIDFLNTMIEPLTCAIFIYYVSLHKKKR